GTEGLFGRGDRVDGRDECAHAAHDRVRDARDRVHALTRNEKVDKTESQQHADEVEQRVSGRAGRGARDARTRGARARAAPASSWSTRRARRAELAPASQDLGVLDALA